MLKGNLIKLLEAYPDDMVVKFRFGPLTVADIHYVRTNPFIKNAETNDEEVVIILENTDLKNGKYP